MIWKTVGTFYVRKKGTSKGLYYSVEAEKYDSNWSEMSSKFDELLTRKLVASPGGWDQLNIPS